MKDKVKRLVEFIEKEPHIMLNDDKISELTGETSIGSFRNKFKRDIGIPIDKYRKRRQLSLIIEEIKNSSKNINSSNLEPWVDGDSFYRSFKAEFGIGPKKYLNGEDVCLQEKLDIDLIFSKLEIIKKLRREFGSHEESLLFLLMLPPVKINNIIAEGIKRTNKKDFAKKVAVYHHKGTHKKFLADLIEKYYDINTIFQIQSFSKSFFEKQSYSCVKSPKFILVDRKLITRLIQLVEIDELYKLIS